MLNDNNRIEEIEERIKALEKEKKALEDKRFPKKGDEYWFINHFGVAEKGKWLSDKVAKFNVYKTKEDAEKSLKEPEIQVVKRVVKREDLDEILDGFGFPKLPKLPTVWL